MISTGTRFVFNPLFEAAWNVGPQGRECKQEAGEAIVAEAQAIAPVATGAYRDSLHVETDGSGDVAVVAGVWYGGLLEFGTADTPTFAPLRRGVEQAGFTWRPPA